MWDGTFHVPAGRNLRIRATNYVEIAEFEKLWKGQLIKVKDFERHTVHRAAHPNDKLSLFRQCRVEKIGPHITYTRKTPGDGCVISFGWILTAKDMHERNLYSQLAERC